MIELVAENGYKNFKVRDLVRRAEVSSRAFYQHFESIEDCFLQTYELVVRRATRRIIAAQSAEPDWRRRPRLIFEEFVEGLAREPKSSRLTLVEAYAAGEDFFDQVWRAERVFEGMVAECLARAPGGVVVPPLIVEGIVSGISAIARRRLLAGKVPELSRSAEGLIAWALSYPSPAAIELAELDHESVWRDTTLEPSPSPSPRSVGGRRPGDGDRALILTAVAKLAAKDGYAGLTIPRIRATAGVSRRQFSDGFGDVEHAYLATLEQHSSEALGKAARAQAAAGSEAGGIYRAIAALCEHVAGDPFLTKVCLADDFPPTLQGARYRRRLIAAVVEPFHDGLRSSNMEPLATEATIAAVWSVFHRHIIRAPALRPEISSTLAYLALAPAIGARDAVAAIRNEQQPQPNTPGVF